MRIQVLYFGVLKDAFGRERDSLELPHGASIDDALGILAARASNIQGKMWSSLAVAVNLHYANRSTLLQPADELALLPPVSGGLYRLVRMAES